MASHRFVVAAVTAAAVLAVAAPADAQLGTWINPSGGSWSDSGSWQGGTIAGGMDNTADFSTLDLTGHATVTLDGARTIGGLTFGDVTPSHNWTLSAGSGGTLTLDVTTGVPLVTVNNQTATISAVIAGADGLRKSGAGVLTLDTAANTLIGNVVISQGTLAAGHASSLGSTANTVTLGDASSGASAVVFKIENTTAGTVTVNSIITSNFGSSQTIRLNTGSSLGANATGLFSTIDLAGTKSLTIQATNTGGHSTAQDWTGRIIGSGIAAGSTALTLDGTSTALRLTFGGTTGQQVNTFTGDVLIKGFVNTQGTTYAGQVAARQNLGFLNSNVTIDPSSTWRIVWGGETVQQLNGSGNVHLDNQNALNNIGLTVGANNATGGVHSGVIYGGFGVAKVGTGVQAFSGANTYGGATSILSGTLLVNGTHTGLGGYTVGAGGTLGGTGTLASNVTVNGGGTLAPGASIESLGLGNLTMLDDATFALEINTDLATADLAQVTVNLTLDTDNSVLLALTDLGSNTALTAGTTLTFIDYSGTWNGGLFNLGGANILNDDEVFAFGVNSYRISYNGLFNASSDVVLEVVAVPEPSAGAMLLFGSTTLFCVIRKRRRALATNAPVLR
jgi:autotransporter-associated beta strand protein